MNIYTYLQYIHKLNEVADVLADHFDFNDLVLPASVDELTFFCPC